MAKTQTIAWVNHLLLFSLIALTLVFISYFTIHHNSASLAKYLTETTAAGVTFQQQYAASNVAGGNTCSGRYIYVHHLPTRFNDDVFNSCRDSSLLKNPDMCPNLSNLGFGAQVNIKNPSERLASSWYATNHFSLEVIFRHRLMKSYDCLTNDSSLASLIYVPFYPGFDIVRHLWGNYNTTVRDALGFELVSWLKNQPNWKTSGLWGRDHFFVSGRIAWDLRRPDDDDSHWGSKLMQLPEAMNMTMLSIETTSWSNELGIPYPTYFHPRRVKEVHRWQKRMTRQKRPYLFSFVGGPRANMTDSIRGELINQCLASRRNCKLLNCHSANCTSPIEVLKVFRNSVFCLQPAGDSYTRRSTFDSILAGCIPVFFHPFSAYTQYIWHLPRNYSSYSVYIPENLVREGIVSIRMQLLQVSKAEVVSMRQEVINLIPKVIYRDPRSKSKDFEDAFDIAIKGMLERVGKVRRQIEEGKDPGTGFAEPGSWKLKLEEGWYRERS
ncbi:unnamed protein product [Linum tenue]|uniref:Exostosin GT47 domain-containing protein n=1 Tax=Linum tenue TaxID=586396 RepID=A0AAV0HI52_9ROSI|nr:unnamed protein product [Linum tenue]